VDVALFLATPSPKAVTAAFGTNANCRSHRVMSEFGGEPENIYSHGVFRILTQLGCRSACGRLIRLTRMQAELDRTIKSNQSLSPTR
jgi:hypothetical protein